MTHSHSAEARFIQMPGTILDVRSPGEFLQGRIPGAINLPLFTNEERAIVGTLYKQQGKEAAVLEGLRIVGPKLASFVTTAQNAVGDGYAKVHCWRGGMRSGSMAWLLKTAGMKTVTLEGGYKAFRKWVLQVLATPRQVVVIGGLTGSGKTSLLHALQRYGEQVLDLEKLANHRGSSFGMLGMGEQPSVEQFENEIAMQWARFDLSRPVWIEDESRMVGICKIPDPLFAMMSQAPLYLIERPLSERLNNLHTDYGHVPFSELKHATQRISKRLGGARSQEVISLIDENRLAEAAQLVLQYYDATYSHMLKRRGQKIFAIKAEGLDNENVAALLLQTLEKGEHHGKSD